MTLYVYLLLSWYQSTYRCSILNKSLLNIILKLTSKCSRMTLEYILCRQGLSKHTWNEQYNTQTRTKIYEPDDVLSFVGTEPSNNYIICTIIRWFWRLLKVKAQGCCCRYTDHLLTHLLIEHSLLLKHFLKELTKRRGKMMNLIVNLHES